jgi:membrane associated rhomboid family serine protease
MLSARQPRLIVTPAILAIIVAIFVVMVAVSGEVVFSSTTLVRWGAQFGPGVADGQWWRLLSAMWLYARPLHLALNAIFLWRFGDYVERLLGPVVFLIVYVLAGVVASAVSLQFHGLSVGASGALFGLVGVLLTVAMTSRGSGGLGEMVAELRPNLVSIVVANLFLGFLMQGVDNAAHIGGLAGGLVLGWLVGRHSLDTTPSPRLTVIPIVMTAAIAAAAVFSLSARQDLRAEAARVGMQIDRVEAAYRVARRDIEARRRTPADMAAEAERTVLPLIHDAQGRADEMLRAATASARLSQAYRWEACLDRYDYAWRRRVAGLRDGDAARVADGDARAAAALRDVSRILAGS